MPNHGNLAWKVTTEPIEEPISTSFVKSYSKIETDEDDTMIGNLITAVRQVAEPWLGRALISQTITSYLDWWPDDVIKLPRPPLVSVTGVYTIDEEDGETEYNIDNYFVRTEIEPGELVIKNGAAAPINTDRYHGGFKIVHTNGYGTADDIPQLLKFGLVEWVLFAIENRITSRQPPEEAKPLLEAYRIHKF